MCASFSNILPTLVILKLVYNCWCSLLHMWDINVEEVKEIEMDRPVWWTNVNGWVVRGPEVLSCPCFSRWEAGGPGVGEGLKLLGIKQLSCQELLLTLISKVSTASEWVFEHLAASFCVASFSMCVLRWREVWGAPCRWQQLSCGMRPYVYVCKYVETRAGHFRMTLFHLHLHTCGSVKWSADVSCVAPC